MQQRLRKLSKHQSNLWSKRAPKSNKDRILVASIVALTRHCLNRARKQRVSITWKRSKSMSTHLISEPASRCAEEHRNTAANSFLALAPEFDGMTSKKLQLVTFCQWLQNPTKCKPRFAKFHIFWLLVAPENPTMIPNNLDFKYF